MTGFQPCPRVAVTDGASAAAFWADFDANPRPLVVTQTDIGEMNFLEERGTKEPSGGFSFASGTIKVGGSWSAPYMLTNPGYNPELFEGLAEAYPLPTALSSVSLRPVISIGVNGTGEKDIAHHYHPVTVMRLLQGVKIWALRSPTDRECAANTGTCTDPFRVCDYYALPSSPPPACVQEAGDTSARVPRDRTHSLCHG